MSNSIVELLFVNLNVILVVFVKFINYYLDTCVNLTSVNPCFHPRKLCQFLNDQLLNITDDIKYVLQQKATLR